MHKLMRGNMTSCHSLASKKHMNNVVLRHYLCQNLTQGFGS